MRIGICGNFGHGVESGQTVKTNIVYDSILEFHPELQNDLLKLSTDTLKSKPLSFFAHLLEFEKKCDRIIVLLAENGMKFLLPFILFIAKICRNKVFYIAIGCWIPELSAKNSMVRFCLKKLDGSYVESKTMVRKLNEQGIKNAKYLPNFKNFEAASFSDENHHSDEYRFCTFSRVTKTKGIGEAIAAIKTLYQRGYPVSLDIYGPIDKAYEIEFQSLLANSPESIAYKGCVPSAKSIQYIHQYYALLFPTYYEGEGFPGTLIDALAAGVPVIATDWHFNTEIIENEKNGFIVPTKETEPICQCIINLIEHSDLAQAMRKNCLLSSKQYNANELIDQLLQDII